MSQLLNFGLGLVTSGVNQAIAAGQAKKDRAENYRYNEMAADNADQRQRALIESYYTPEAQMQHIKAAGLSPSIMYGGSGASGTTSAAQGNGGNGIQTQYQPFDPLLAAQIELMHAQAEKTQEEKKTLAGENERGKNEIDKIANETILALNQAGAANAAEELSRSQTAINKVLEYIQSESAEYQIDEIQYQSERAWYDTLSAMHESNLKEIEYNFNSETYETRKGIVEKDLQNLIQDLIVKKSQVKLNNSIIELNEKQKEKIGNEIKDILNQIEVRTKGHNLNVAELKWARESFYKQLESNFQMLNMELNNQLSKELMSDISHIGSNMLGAYILRTVLPKQKPMKPIGFQ